MFASEHWGVSPDIMTLARVWARVADRMVIARKPHMEKWKRGAHGTPSAANPICCAAALATLDLVQANMRPMPPRSAITSSLACASCKQHFDCIGDVRGRGLMIGGGTGPPTAQPQTRRRSVSEGPDARLPQRVLLLLSCGSARCASFRRSW